jgi:hypothetical protein
MVYEIKLEKGNCSCCKKKNILVIENEVEGDFGGVGFISFCLKCYPQYNEDLKDIYIDLSY